MGPIEARADGRRAALGGGRQLKLFAFLLVHANRAVASDDLIDAVWGPKREGAAKRLQMAVARLRRVLESLETDGESLLRTVGGGYLLSVAPGELDADLFRDGVQTGRRALEEGDPERARRILSAALELWRGPPLAEVAFEDFAQAEIRQLEELRLLAIEARVEADLQLGRHAELIGELETHLGQHPTREGLAGQLMLAFYRSGRQAEALEAYQRTRARLVEELGLQPGPALQALQTRIFDQAPELSVNGSNPSSEPQPGPLAASALPSREIWLVGRERELSELSELLRDADVAILTLSGTGGTGKTSLALEAARRAAAAFADDVTLVELASIIDPAQVLGELARALELRLAAGEAPLAGLKRVLRTRRMLLVLDNFEHVLDAAPALGELVETCPYLKLLVTSRAPLRLARERVYPVSTLSHPDPATDESVRELARYPAVALFVERARSRDPMFALTDANAAAVAALSTHLGGLPLGIELAASHAGVLTPQALLDRLKDAGMPAGAPSRRDAPARQATLEATIDWSYALLTGEQRSLFSFLGVFVGGFTFRAAGSVAGTPIDALSADLQALLDQGLIHRRPGPGGDARFEMLEPIREYALMRLKEAGSLDEALVRHARYYADFVESAGSGLLNAAQATWITALDADQANLRAVLSRAEKIGVVGDGLRVAAGVIGYWRNRDLSGEIQRWLEPVLEHCDVDPAMRVNALESLGTAACWTGAVEVAQRALDECITLVEQTGNVSRLAEVEAQKARADFVARDATGAARHAARARELAPPDDGWTRLVVLLLLAASTHDYEEARRDSLEALRLSDVLGDQVWRGWLNANLAYHALIAGDLETARRSTERAIADTGSGRSMMLSAMLMQITALLKLIDGDGYDAAERDLRQALAAAARVGDREHIRELLNELAAIAIQRGDRERAATLAAAAEASYDRPRTALDEMVRDRFLGSLPALALRGCDTFTGAKLTPAHIDALIADLTATVSQVVPVP